MKLISKEGRIFTYNSKTIKMKNFKNLVKLFFTIILLFTMLYFGIKNTQLIPLFSIVGFWLILESLIIIQKS